MKIGSEIKIEFPRITTPNAIGKVIKVTPKQIVVLITQRTFEPKTSGTGITHKFDKYEREWYNNFGHFKKRFWKDTGVEVGGESFILKLKK